MLSTNYSVDRLSFFQMVDIKATGVTALGEALKLAANKLNRKYKNNHEPMNGIYR
jgi:uncharacterized protein YegL